MYEPVNAMNAAIDKWTARQGAGGAERAEIFRQAETTLAQVPAGLRKSELARALGDLPLAINSEAERKIVLGLRHLNERLLGDPPPGFFPPERLLETIRVARENGADGIVLFSGGSIERGHLWPAVKEGLSR